MLQKIELQQLQSLNLQEVTNYKKQAQARKAELEALKTKGGESWTENLQKELEDVVIFLVDIDDIIEEKQKESASKYTVKPGTEDMVHLSIVQGRRFNPLTGKEESKAYTQMFTYSEWQLFKKAFAGLGYTILDVLHDPYGDAKNYITKN